jgi:hypothetical protein
MQPDWSCFSVNSYRFFFLFSSIVMIVPHYLQKYLFALLLNIIIPMLYFLFEVSWYVYCLHTKVSKIVAVQEEMIFLVFLNSKLSFWVIKSSNLSIVGFCVSFMVTFVMIFIYFTNLLKLFSTINYIWFIND